MARQTDYKEYARALRDELNTTVKEAVVAAQAAANGDAERLTGEIADLLTKLGGAIAELGEHHDKETMAAHAAASAALAKVRAEFHSELPDSRSNESLGKAAESFATATDEMKKEEGDLVRSGENIGALAGSVGNVETANLKPEIEVASVIPGQYNPIMGIIQNAGEHLGAYADGI